MNRDARDKWRKSPGKYLIPQRSPPGCCVLHERNIIDTWPSQARFEVLVFWKVVKFFDWNTVVFVSVHLCFAVTVSWNNVAILSSARETFSFQFSLEEGQVTETSGHGTPCCALTYVDVTWISLSWNLPPQVREKMSQIGSSTIASMTKINVGESSRKAAFSIVSRARHCVQDAQIVILDARNLSECVNLDAQMVLLDAQNWSIGIQLVDFENCFQIWWMKYKQVHLNEFWKCIQMQIKKKKETSFQHHWLVHFDLCTSASSAVVV